jgi:hypothetical protein
MGPVGSNLTLKWDDVGAPLRGKSVRPDHQDPLNLTAADPADVHYSSLSVDARCENSTTILLSIGIKSVMGLTNKRI